MGSVSQSLPVSPLSLTCCIYSSSPSWSWPRSQKDCRQNTAVTRPVARFALPMRSVFPPMLPVSYLLAVPQTNVVAPHLQEVPNTAVTHPVARFALPVRSVFPLVWLASCLHAAGQTNVVVDITGRLGGETDIGHNISVNCIRMINPLLSK